jgi:hypothetical protein
MTWWAKAGKRASPKPSRGAVTNQAGEGAVCVSNAPVFGESHPFRAGLNYSLQYLWIESFRGAY